MKIYSFIILSIIQLSFSKSTYKKDYDSRSIEGDTLIDKILSADKFNELADKIVDKALAKFKNKKSSPIGREYPSSPSVENVKKNTTPDFKSNKDKVSLNPKRKDRKHKSAAKIDVDAVLQKKALPLGNLSFRYEHFRQIFASTTSEKPIAKVSHDYRADAKLENTKENSVKQEDSLKAKYYSDEHNKSDKDNDNKSKEQPNSNENKNTDLSSENLRFDEKPKNEELQTVRPQSGENQFGNGKNIHWNETEDDSRESAKNTTEGKNQIPEQAPEIVNRADDGDQPVSDDEKQSDALEEASHEEMKERKRLIRREGDKVFTLNESPDYAEYHEKIAELRKSLGTKIR